MTGGGAAVCKAEKQGLRGREKDRDHWHSHTSKFLPFYNEKNTESLFENHSKIPSETNHTTHVQHANKQARCKDGHACCLILSPQQQKQINGLTDTRRN